MNEARKGTNIDYVSDSDSSAHYTLARTGGFSVKRIGNLVFVMSTGGSFGQSLQVGAYNIDDKTYTEIADNYEAIEAWENIQSCY